ncbi:MAG: UDP-N-acetylglucosamine 4-epimerase [Chlamydiae bacterium]|nr:UDP-N-acetylglucosamine 4-epimerase [Chlamydiota bacterium]
MKRVLITGCAGFIGFHLALALKKLGFDVLGFDNYNDYYCIQLKKDRSDLLKEKGISILTGDLVNKSSLEKAYKEFNPTHVVHLAAQAGVRYSLVNPDAYIQSNIVGFTNLLEVMKKDPSVPLIYASSSSVYGDSTQTPYSENSDTDTPINLYGATKKANELIAYAYHSLYGNRMIGLRFFTVYGPWGRPDMAYYHFSEKILAQAPIPVYEGAKIQRDFTYIDDIVDGIIRAMNCSEKFEVFNLGNHTPILLNTFIETLETALDKQAIKNYMPKAAGDMEVTHADLTKSHLKLGYVPKTNIQQGLKSFADWFVAYTEEKSLQKKLRAHL